MSSLARYPVPQAVASGAIDKPRLHFHLEPTIVPDPVLDFLRPLQATPEATPAGAVDDSRLYFRLEPTIIADVAARRRRLAITPELGYEAGYKPIVSREM